MANKNDFGTELSALKWLICHHKAKEQYRCQMVEDLKIKDGDRVLDSASGPGFWSLLFANKVKPSGKVVGLDLSEESIDFAKNQLQHYPDYREIVAYVQGNLSRLPYENRSFDLVFCGNVLSYIPPGHLLEAIAEQKRVVKKGGRLVFKDWDDGTILYHPLPPELRLRVIAATAKAIDNESQLDYTDNFMAPKVRGVLQQSGLQNVSTRLYPTPIVPPFSEETRYYLVEHTRWLTEKAAPFLSKEELQMWISYFDPKSSQYILDREDFYYYTVETINIGTV